MFITVIMRIWKNKFLTKWQKKKNINLSPPCISYQFSLDIAFFGNSCTFANQKKKWFSRCSFVDEGKFSRFSLILIQYWRRIGDTGHLICLTHLLFSTENVPYQISKTLSKEISENENCNRFSPLKRFWNWLAEYFCMLVVFISITRPSIAELSVIAVVSLATPPGHAYLRTPQSLQ